MTEVLQRKSVAAAESAGNLRLSFLLDPLRSLMLALWCESVSHCPLVSPAVKNQPPAVAASFQLAGSEPASWKLAATKSVSPLCSMSVIKLLGGRNFGTQVSFHDANNE